MRAYRDTYHDADGEEWLRSSAVAELLQVSPKTVNRWTKEGKFQGVRYTLGHHARYSRSAIESLRAELTFTPDGAR